MRRLTKGQVAVIVTTLAIGTVNANGPDEIRTTNLDRVRAVHESSAPPFTPLSFYIPIGGYGHGSSPSSSPSGSSGSGTGGGAPRDPKVPDGCDKKSPSNEKGNPVLISTGNKIEREVDFESAGEMGLGLRRTYNHYWQGVGIFGRYWVSNFDYKLTFGTSGLNNCYPRPGGGTCSIGSNSVIYASGPDGGSVKYVRAADGIFYQDVPSPISRIVREANGTFTLHGDEGERETYNASGYVTSVKNEHGVGWTFSYVNGTYPSRVTHASGRYIDFIWTNGQLTSARDPANRYYGYSYTANKFGLGMHRLAATSSPGSAAGSPPTTVAYHYEHADATALTGKSIDGVRYSTFGYSANGFATSTEHAWGQERFTFAYTPGPDGLLTVLETNPLGKQATHVFKNGELQSVTGHPSAHCAATYSLVEYENGRVAMTSDFNGNQTSFGYNARGQVVTKIEAYGTLEARTTQYVWDDTLNRLKSVTIAGHSTTEYTYTADNRPASETVTNLKTTGVTGQTRTATYAYTRHPNGLLATITVDGPLPGDGDAIIRTYNSAGDLVETRNSLGHVVTRSMYNGLGLPGRIVGLDGGTTDLLYDERGRLLRERRYFGSGHADTTREFGASGLLLASTTADGHTKRFDLAPESRTPV